MNINAFAAVADGCPLSNVAIALTEAITAEDQLESARKTLSKEQLQRSAASRLAELQEIGGRLDRAADHARDLTPTSPTGALVQLALLFSAGVMLDANSYGSDELVELAGEIMDRARSLIRHVTETTGAVMPPAIADYYMGAATAA